MLAHHLDYATVVPPLILRAFSFRRIYLASFTESITPPDIRQGLVENSVSTMLSHE
jgi:hypothetical protein